ncbi:MAG: RNA methyltransferase [Alphaproteobacteria bacterium]|jgi:tRNA G18 (ribose-2'-O)-methylase SpoU|nr:RNA methyltransferase [Alphaproteobacteria bacterium]MBT7943684.1 RNA methyltransferase [Alphaproteobacteria bacterium]
MRGYFAIGVEGISKAMNVGSLFRTAHAFGAGFVFTVDANYERGEGGRADTSDAPGHVPFYSFPDTTSMVLPNDCTLVGVELTDDAIDLPSFRHPPQAAYVMGPERGSLSPEMMAKCEFVVKIPTRFCVNVGVAGAILMYDRVSSLGQFPRRPISPGGPTEALAEHTFGDPVIRNKMKKFQDTPPGETEPDGT